MEIEKYRRRFARMRERSRKAHEKKLRAWRRRWHAGVCRLLPGDIVTNRATGRKMELIEVSPAGLLVLIVAKTDPERKQWNRRETSVMWPADWCWLPNQQMTLFADSKPLTA